MIVIIIIIIHCSLPAMIYNVVFQGAHHTKIGFMCDVMALAGYVFQHMSTKKSHICFIGRYTVTWGQLLDGTFPHYLHFALT